MKILVLNSGSSSIKFQLFSMKDKKVLATGIVEEIGNKNSKVKIETIDGKKRERSAPVPNHKIGFEAMEELLSKTGALKSLKNLDAIGHRVVHGGETFSTPVLIDQGVIETLKIISPLAPLHNPAHISGIETAIAHSNGVPQVAVFDTAFHRTVPQYAYMYALPYEFYESLHIRKYGFHGTSHHYVSKISAKYLNIPYERFNAISLHLGNGASVTAIKNGQSIDTSMGLSPLEGLIMGTRSGDLDPAILFYLHREKGYDVEELDVLLNKKSGLKGICGESDMRTIGEMYKKGDAKATLALDMFSYRIKKYIGSYSAIIGSPIDAVIFTGGIGQNGDFLRERVCKGLDGLGICLDHEANKKIDTKKISPIHDTGAKVPILVVPTHEELEIAEQTKMIVSATHS